MRRAGVAVAVALLVGIPQAATAQGTAARLQGTFTMHGVLTTADHVYGEHRGEHVQRSWTFTPQCGTGSCQQVVLERQRSGKLIADVLVLERQTPDLYLGRGRFWVPLRCGGRVIAHGGLAKETISVRITQTATVGATIFATAVSAKYDNPTRVNLTRCPGGIGHDAARYQGQLASALP
jgi:hypothetical protein